MTTPEDMERARGLQHAIYGQEAEVEVGWWVVPAAGLMLVALLAALVAAPIVWLADGLASVSTRLVRRGRGRSCGQAQEEEGRDGDAVLRAEP